MKFLYILIFGSCFVSTVFTQIPNGGFEDWQPVSNYEKPDLWETNQNAGYHRFVKDTVSVEGKFSLKIIPGPYSAFWECRSMAWTSVQLDTSVGENKSLVFFARSIPDSTNSFQSVFLQIKCWFWSKGQFVSSSKWETFDPTMDFTKVQIPLPDPDIDSLEIWI